MTIGELLVKLGLDPSTYAKGLSEAESKTKSATTNVGKHFDDAGSHVTKFGGILSGIGMGVGLGMFNLASEGLGKVMDILPDATKEFEAQQVTMTALAVAVNNAEPGYGKLGDSWKANFEIGNKLGFTTIDQADALTLLEGATKSADDAQNAMNAAEDLARTRHVDLATATGVVTKAMEGNYKGLKAYGILVTPVTTAVDKLTASHHKATAAQLAAAKAADKAATQTGILTDIEKVAGGQAADYANTSTGKLAAAHIRVTEAMVKLGGIVDQISTAVMPALADAFSNVMDAVGPLLDQLSAQMPSIIAQASAAFDWMRINVLPPLRQAFQVFVSDVLPAIGAALSWIAENVLPKLIAAFEWFMTNVWPVLVKAFQFFVNDVMPPVISILEQTADFVSNTLAPAISQIVTAVLPPLRAGFQVVSDFVRDVFIPIHQKIADFLLHTVAPAVDNIVTAVLPPLKTAFKIVSDFISNVLIPAIGNISSAFGAVRDGVGAIWDGVTSTIKGAINGIIDMVNGLIGALDAVQIHVHYTFPSVDLGPLGKIGGETVGYDWGGFGIGRVPKLHAGGLVPGPAGANVLMMLQAGERVTPAAQVNSTSLDGSAAGLLQAAAALIAAAQALAASKTSTQNVNLRQAVLGYVSS